MEEDVQIRLELPKASRTTYATVCFSADGRRRNDVPKQQWRIGNRAWEVDEKGQRKQVSSVR